MNQPQTINISNSTIFRVILFLLFFAFLYLISDILLVVFVAMTVAMAINGPVSWLQKRHVPRTLGVVFIYLVFCLFVSLVIISLFPPLAEQITNLTESFPDLVSKLNIGIQEFWGRYEINFNLRSFLSEISGRLEQAASSVTETMIGVFGGFFSMIVVLVISFYLSVEEKGVKKFLVELVLQEHQNYLSGLIERIEVKIGGWLRGQLLLMLIVGVLTYIGLLVLGVGEYALVLALIACFLEIIPYVGPILSAIPAVILTFAISPFLSFAVIILYLVVQQLENHIIVPQVMKKTVGLNPIVIIVVMLIGAKLAGALGIILSVPLAASIGEFLKDFMGKEG